MKQSFFPNETQRMRDRITISKSDIFQKDQLYLFPQETNQVLIKFLSDIVPSDTIIIIEACV